jgi:hypothetical protein
LKVSQAPVSINLRDTQGGKPGSNVLAQVRGYVFGNSAGFQISIQLGIDNHWLPKDIPVKPGGHIVFGRDARDASLLGIPTDDFTKFGRTVKGAWPTKRCGYLEAPLLPFGVRSDLSIPISWS